MSQSNAPTRAVLTRILFGVTSFGAAIGIMYLLYLKQKKKGPTADSNSTSVMSKKKKRMSSGEKNRVTFSDQNEIICTASSPVSLNKDDMEEDYDIKNADVKVTNDHHQPEVQAKSNKDVFSELESLESSSNGQPQLNDVLDNDSIIAVTGVEEDTIKKVVSPSTKAASANGHGLQQAITPETDYDRTAMVRELLINRDHVPMLIGRKGTNIRAIQQESNTIINFKDETLENGDRVCEIRGSGQDITVAESLIEKHIMEQPVITSLTMYIPHSSVGRIIGKGGESIRGIQDMSKAKVIVDTANQFHNKGGAGGDAVRMVLVTLRGTEEQINCARQMIIEKVEEEKTLRRNIDVITQSRAPRRTTSTSNSSPSNNPSSVNGNHSLPSINSGVLEVFVSCAYHPNDFWIQVRGRESIELDKLTESMTEWYTQQPPPEQLSLSIGEIIAAPFDVDGKMYRGKILKLVDDTAEVFYVDYGDKRTIKTSDLRVIHPEFLCLRFQAIQATLNLGCAEERWSDDTIVTFCDLTYCAQWSCLTAKVKDYLKASGDSKQTVLWVELLDNDKNLNIGNELVVRGLATPNDTVHLPTSDNSDLPTTSSNNSNKKSYASVVADEPKVSEDGSKEGPSLGEDNLNGN